MTDTTTTREMLVQDTLGRVRTPREKREQILEEYERSGMSGAAFAALVGVEVREPGLVDPAAATVRWVEAVPAHARRRAARCVCKSVQRCGWK